MNLRDDQLIISASDLSNHLACKHLTALNIDAAHGKIPVPEYRDPSLVVLQERGLAFEQQYLDQLKADGWEVDDVPAGDDQVAHDRTIAAMKAGKQVIYQAVIQEGNAYGRIDFLRRVEKPSDLGDWSYEVVDTKLAKETRAGTILQLCMYAELLSYFQGVLPEYIHVVTPEDGFTELSYRVSDFIYYYNTVADDLNDSVRLHFASGHDTYPIPVAHCDVCRWWRACHTKRRADDHLSLVAGLSNSHTKEIQAWGLATVTSFAQHEGILPKPSRGARETYSRLQEQAHVQLRSRENGEIVYDVLPVGEGQGLACLPAPSAGDVFFDFEGDPYVGTVGIEYLFGFVEHQTGRYHALWAFTAEDEKRAFEQFIDEMMVRWEKHPDFHIYHYTPYEPGAIKRLMGRYGTREQEVDRLLRSQRFVDLYQVVRQALRVGVERYSLKELEPIFGFTRQLPLIEAAANKRALESLLERGGNPQSIPETCTAVQHYNEDDCESTRQLRHFLETIRQRLVNEGTTIARPEAADDEPSEKITEHLARITPLFEHLTAGVPADPAQRDPAQQANYLLAHMLDWYRREDKSFWWEYFRIQQLTEDDYLDEKSAIWGLSYTGKRRAEKRSQADTYRFPSQECDVRIGDKVTTPAGEELGEVLHIDHAEGTIEIKKRGDKVDVHPVALLKKAENFKAKEKEESIIRLAQWVMAHGIDADGPYRAGRDLLLRNSPRTGQPFSSDAPPQDKAVAWALSLAQGILPIQGPPGTGKSHTAAKMILAFIRQGKKVGITAMSHKVIENLMEKVYKMSQQEGVALQSVKKMSEQSDVESPYFTPLKTNDDAIAAVRNPAIHLVGGTPFLWAREAFHESVDVLFVDEAGQLSLIDTLAVSHAGKNLVLLGDPQQLQQPQQGTHPEGTEVSSLAHVLGDANTIPSEQGVLLDTTWRMHPEVSKFVSELFYDNKLHSKHELHYQSISGSSRLDGSGLRLHLTGHQANRHASVEEVEVVSSLINSLTQPGVTYHDAQNRPKQITNEDILVIAPYNAQVALLKERLPAGMAIGTVDKFQGQEAPVVIFSVTSSSPEDAPRGMEFLYSGNRLNVAVSRARALFIMVANEPLFSPECRSVPQMKLANAFCSYFEVARKV